MAFQTSGNVSFSLAALIASISGFGGIAMGWGMYRQALNDLRQRMDRKDLADDERDRAISLLVSNISALSAVSTENAKQLERLASIIDRMATYPRWPTPPIDHKIVP